MNAEHARAEAPECPTITPEQADNRLCLRFLASAAAGVVVYFAVMLAPQLFAATLAFLAMLAVAEALSGKSGETEDV